MKRHVFVLLLIIFAITACTGSRIQTKSMVEDLGSPEKVDLLRQRANDFWAAFVEEDYETVYGIFDPFYRARNSLQAFLKRTKVKYHEYEVKDITVEGNIAKVRVRIVSSVPGIMGKMGQVFSQPPAPSEMTETWLYVYDDWYKEYYMGMVEKPIVYY